MVLCTNVYPSNYDHLLKSFLTRKSEYLLREVKKQLLKKPIVFPLK